MFEKKFKKFCQELPEKEEITIDILVEQHTEKLIIEFSKEIDQWLLTSEKTPQDYDFYLYRLIIEGAKYMQEVRQVVLKDFLVEHINQIK